MDIDYKDWIGEVLVWKSPWDDTEEIFIAQHYTPDENYPHHTPRFWYRGKGYIAANCEKLPEMTKQEFEKYANEFEFMGGLRP